MCESPEAKTANSGSAPPFGHCSPHVDPSDVDSSSERSFEGAPPLDLGTFTAKHNDPAREPQSEPSDPPTGSPAESLQGPTNTSTQEHVSQQTPLPRSFARTRHSGMRPTQTGPTNEILATCRTVTLSVGGREFLTTRDTLTNGSAFFRDLLDDSAKSGKQPDGTYFIDADASLFDDILQFLRRGLLPVYWDKQKGHDHARYAALLAEAQFFQLDKLSLWLKQKSYLQAVKHHISAEICPGPTGLAVVHGADVERQPLFCFRRVEKKQAFDRVYACPRGIDVHQRPKDCGKACKMARGEAAPKYIDKPAKLSNGEPRYIETVFYDVLVISKTTAFDDSICIPEN